MLSLAVLLFAYDSGHHHDAPKTRFDNVHRALPVERLDVNCCGMGDRFKVILRHLLDNRDTAMAVYWGECATARGLARHNVFAGIFEATRRVVPFAPNRSSTPLSSHGVSRRNATIESQIRGRCNNCNNILGDPLVQRVFFDLLFSLSAPLRVEIDAFKRSVGWDGERTIALHVRTGNSDGNRVDKSFVQQRRGKEIEIQGLENYLAAHMRRAATLAAELGLGDDFRVFVVSAPPSPSPHSRSRPHASPPLPPLPPLPPPSTEAFLRRSATASASLTRWQT